MVKRRTLGEGLTPEEESFLKGNQTPAKPKPQPQKQKEKKPMNQTALKQEFAPTPMAEPIAPSTMHTGMVGLNTRVEPAISAALLRASVERKIQRKSRAAVQDIVNEALTEWLKQAGYLGPSN